MTSHRIVAIPALELLLPIWCSAQSTRPAVSLEEFNTLARQLGRRMRRSATPPSSAWRNLAATS
jgi:hypothetical protein